MSISRRRVMVKGSVMTMGAAAMLVAGTSIVAADPAVGSNGGDAETDESHQAKRNKTREDRERREAEKKEEPNTQAHIGNQTTRRGQDQMSNQNRRTWRQQGAGSISPGHDGASSQDGDDDNS